MGDCTNVPSSLRYLAAALDREDIPSARAAFDALAKLLGFQRIE
jgi:hypothetical protein